jgi:hypothetical protein
MTYISQTDVAITLATAASIIDTQGWTVGTFGHIDDGPCCAYRAISRAAGDSQALCNDTVVAFENHLRETAARVMALPAVEWQLVPGLDQIVYWNDHLASDATQVVATLNDAASSLIGTP